MFRFLPGTPPRVLKSSIDFSRVEEHLGDAVPQPFSFLNDSVWLKVGGAVIFDGKRLVAPLARDFLNR